MWTVQRTSWNICIMWGLCVSSNIRKTRTPEYITACQLWQWHVSDLRLGGWTIIVWQTAAWTCTFSCTINTTITLQLQRLKMRLGSCLWPLLTGGFYGSGHYMCCWRCGTRVTIHHQLTNAQTHRSHGLRFAPALLNRYSFYTTQRLSMVDQSTSAAAITTLHTIVRNILCICITHYLRDWPIQTLWNAIISLMTLLLHMLIQSFTLL